MCGASKESSTRTVLALFSDSLTSIRRTLLSHGSWKSRYLRTAGESSFDIFSRALDCGSIDLPQLRLEQIVEHNLRSVSWIGVCAVVNDAGRGHAVEQTALAGQPGSSRSSSTIALRIEQE